VDLQSGVHHGSVLREPSRKKTRGSKRYRKRGGFGKEKESRGLLRAFQKRGKVENQGEVNKGGVTLSKLYVQGKGGRAIELRKKS